MPVRTRFAPSPTGYPHIGGVGTALFNWLYARHCGGTFILRIEDTDRERSTDESVQAILDGMAWMGLDYDEGPVYQTGRLERYQRVIDQLLDAGKAYRCYCTKEELDKIREEQRAQGIKPRYNRHCRDRHNPERPDARPVIRFKNPLQGSVAFDDAIRGKVVISNDELDDLVIARTNGGPTYNFAVVVDDIDMEITHVIRGDDHVNNTPKQINIFKALGAEPPAYAHVSMILGGDGAKLSKRHGALGVMEYRAMGFLPDGLLNYLVRLGWSHGDQELFTRAEMEQLFDFDHVSSSPARFDMEKAYWVNHQYLKTAPMDVVAPEFDWHLRRLEIDPANGPSLAAVIESQRERCRTLAEMAEKSAFFFRDLDGYNEKDAAKHLGSTAAPVLEALVNGLEALPAWSAEAAHGVVHQVGEQLGVKLGQVAQPIRVACCGMAVSPPIDQTLLLLGRERTLSRLRAALSWIARNAG